MQNRTILRFLGSFLVIICLAVMLSYLMYYTSFADSDSKGNAEVKTTHSKTETGGDMAVMVYAIALGFLGLFSMYNALEVYKKKEDIERELRGILEKYADAVAKLEKRKNDMRLDYKEIELNIREYKSKAHEKLIQMSAQVEDRVKDQLSMIEKKFNGMIDEIGKSQGDMKVTIEKAKKEFHSFRVTMAKDFNRHYYSYTLYTLIPHYLGDLKNRIRVESAFHWFSQEGDSDDLELLRERHKVLLDEDAELTELCSKAINELRTKLTIGNTRHS